MAAQQLSAALITAAVATVTRTISIVAEAAPTTVVVEFIAAAQSSEAAASPSGAAVQPSGAAALRFAAEPREVARVLPAAEAEDI